jgi:aryl-alcohol dehydrogenase-like predicted oxidoreductase
MDAGKVAPMLATRPIGHTGLTTTFIGFGALEIGRDWGIGDSIQRQRPSDDEATTVLNGVLDLGISLIDTASAYHKSEERIGNSIAGRRLDYILATKCGEHNNEPNTYYDFSYEAIKNSIDRSLELLKTDVIDILQIHFGPDPKKVLSDGECVRAMREAQDAGKVRFLGASVDGEPLDIAIGSGDFQVVQVGYSLLNQSQADNIKRAADNGIGVLIRSGLAGGWLTSRALNKPAPERPDALNTLLEECGGDTTLLTQKAVQFLQANEAISSVLWGTKNLANIKIATELAS